MKKIFSLPILLVAFTLAVVSGCNDDFLNKNPLDQVSSETFWNTDEDAKMALAGCYSRLQSDFLGYRRVWLDCLTDNAFAEWGYYSMASMTLGVISPTTGGAV